MTLSIIKALAAQDILDRAARKPRAFLGMDADANILNPAAPVTLAATSGTGQIVGPGAGELYVIPHITLVSQGATPSVAITLNPGTYVLGRALAPTTGSVGLVPPVISVTNGPIFLGEGETLDFANTGSGACTLWYAYYKISLGNRTLVRKQVSSGTPVELIPAAATGFRNRWATALGIGGPSPVLRATLIIFNDDTAAIVPTLYSGGVMFARAASTAAGSAASPIASHHELTVTDDALTIALAGAVATRPVSVLGCYETLPLVG